MVFVEDAKDALSESQDAVTDIPDFVDVIIIGAGPTGLALACQLARYNVNFLIFDLQPKPSEDRNLVLLHSRSLEYFTDLGISLIRYGKILKAVDTYVNSSLYSSLKFSDTSSSTCLAIDQAQLEAALNDKLESLGCSVLRPYAICKIESFNRPINTNNATENFPTRAYSQFGQNKFSSYLQQFVHSVDDGASSPQAPNKPNADLTELENADYCVVHINKIDKFGKCVKTEINNVRCKYVVGCDGMSSCVRKASEIEYEKAGQAAEYFFAEVAVQWGLKLNTESISVLQTMQGGVVVVPMADDRWHIFCSRLVNSFDLNEITVQRESPDFQELQQILTTITPNTVIETLYSSLSYTSCPRLGSTFRKNDIILLGDAIHLYPPILGYGVNGGIMDVFNVSWKLAAVIAGASPKLLDTYETERREIISKEFSCFPNPVFNVLAKPSTPLRFILAIFSSNLAGLDNFGSCLCEMIKQSTGCYTSSLLNSENKLSRYSVAPGSHYKDASVVLVPVVGEYNLTVHDSLTRLSRFIQESKHTLILAIYVFPPGTKAQTLFGCRRNEEAIRWNSDTLIRLSKLARLLSETIRGADSETSELTVLWLLCGLVNLKSQSNAVALENIKDHVPHRLRQFFIQKFRTNSRSYILVDSENEVSELYQLRLAEPDSFYGSTKSGAFVLLRPDGYVCSNGYSGDSSAMSAAFDYALNWFCN